MFCSENYISTKTNYGIMFSKTIFKDKHLICFEENVKLIVLYQLTDLDQKINPICYSYTCCEAVWTAI